MEHHKKGYDFQFVLILVLLSNPLVGSTSIRPREKEERSKWKLNPLSKTSIKTIKDKDGEIFHCIDMYKQLAFNNPFLKENHTIQLTGIRFESKPSWKYYGAQVIMDVFNISNISKFQKSSMHLLLSRGSSGPSDNWNSIICGWHVYPDKYGDKTPRLYTFWTSDGYQKIGCYNLYCPGFIQLSRSFTPGMKLSIGKGVLKLTVYRDKKTLNWFLLLGEHEIIGYWSKEIFNNLVDSSHDEVAGYVYSPLYENSPPMGNGIFPNPDPSKACEVKHIKLLNENGDFIVPGSDTTYFLFNDLPDYYGVVIECGVDEFSLSVGGSRGYKNN